MEYRYLGNSGLKVSALSFGAWVTFSDQVGEDIAYKCMKEAYDSGVNFFDNAEVYANGQAEIIMGNILKKTGWKRSDLIISTKLFWGGNGPNDVGLSRKHLIEGTDSALMRLQLDYVDLIFCHRPDFHTPVEETVRAMNHIINQGKALYWGTSEWPAERILEAYHIAIREHLTPPLMEQPEYNMFRRDKMEKEFLPLFEKFKLGTTVWSPLASGVLTGKYNSGLSGDTRLSLPNYEWLKNYVLSNEGKERIEKVKMLEPIANEIGISLAEMGLSWCLKNPNVSTVITGASNPEQVKVNMKALEAVSKLNDEAMNKIEEVIQTKPKLDYDWRS